MLAVIETGGKQYLISPKQKIKIEKIKDVKEGDEIVFDKVLLVTANEDIRMQRAIERKNITEESIKERIALQMPESEKRKHADFIIENNGNEDQLRDACKVFWEKIKE